MNKQTHSLNSLAAVLAHPAIWQGHAARQVDYIPTEHAALDATLPGHGIPAHGLIEALCDTWGMGELRVFTPVLRALNTQGWLVFVAPPYQLYPRTLRRLGFDLSKVLVVDAAQTKDALWAVEQLLNTSQCTAVVTWPDNNQLQGKDQLLRRIQVAAETNHTLALALRSVKQSSAPAALRLSIQSIAGKQVLVTPLKSRHGLLNTTSIRLQV